MTLLGPDDAEQGRKSLLQVVGTVPAGRQKEATMKVQRNNAMLEKIDAALSEYEREMRRSATERLYVARVQRDARRAARSTK